MRSKFHISNEPLICLSHNSDFEYLTIGGYSRLVYIVSNRSGKILSQLKGHTYQIYAVQFNPNHKQVVSGGKEKDLYFWDIPTQSLKNKLKGHLSHILDLFYYNEDVVLSGSLDSTAKIWDIRSNKCVQTFDDATDGVLRVLAVENEIITTSTDGCLRTYDIRNNKLIVDAHYSPITDVQLFKGGKQLLTYSQDGIVRTIQRENGKLFKKCIREPFTTNLKCKLMGNDDKIVCGDSDGVVTVYDANGTIANEIKCHEKCVQSISCHTSENKFASIGEDGFLNLHFNV